MTPEQKIKREIIIKACEFGGRSVPDLSSGELIDAAYGEFLEEDDNCYLLDAESEMRGSYDAETDVECQWSRHYESKSVAKKMVDGSWVGWTYWYGGGKHGAPEDVSWIEYAYDLDVEEEEKLVTVLTFKKVYNAEAEA